MAAGHEASCLSSGWALLLRDAILDSLSLPSLLDREAQIVTSYESTLGGSGSHLAFSVNGSLVTTVPRFGSLDFSDPANRPSCDMSVQVAKLTRCSDNGPEGRMSC